MSTQNVTLDQSYIDNTLIPDLNFVIFNTECSWNSAYISQFKFAGGNSSYSFGLYQYDVGSNPLAQAFLTQIGFSANQIALLSQNGTLISSQLASLNAQLSEALKNPANAAALQSLNETWASTELVPQLQNLLNILNQNNPNIALQIYQNLDLQLRLLDYANQFNGISPNGPLEQWLAHLTPSTQLTDAMVQNFVMSTQEGMNHPTLEAGRESRLNEAIKALSNGAALSAATEIYAYYSGTLPIDYSSQILSSNQSGDTWTDAATGTNGADTYNIDGSSSSKVIYADGNYATTLDDGQGNITTDYYTKDGVEIRSTWVHSDGSSGTVDLYADGQTQIPGAGADAVPPSSFTVLQNPDGTYTTMGWNAQNTSTTTQFDANGNPTSQSSGSGTGANDQTVASQSTVFVPETSSTEGIEQTTTYNSSGQQIGVSWYAAYANGTVDPNGASVSLATGAEATGTSWGWSGVMAASGTETFNASGVQTLDIKALDGTSWVVTNEQQGSTVSHESSSGVLLSDQWAIADGPGVISSVPASASVTGSDTFNADGSGTGSFSDARDGTVGTVTLTSQGDITVVNTNAGGTVTSEDIWNASNGTYEIAMLSSTGTTLGVYDYLANGNVIATDYAPDGTTIADQQTVASGLVVNPDGSSFSKIVNTDNSYTVYYQNASGDTTAYQYSASGQLTGSYHTSSYDYQHADWSGTLANGSAWTSTFNNYTPTFTDAQGNAWTWYLNAAGVETGADYVNAALGTHGYITYGANGAAYEVDYAANGTYTTISQDGLGDVTDTFFDANGNETGDSWKTANGAHGGDTYNADGSSSGTSINADGSYGSYTDDGKGDMVSAEYSAAGVMLSEVWTNADGTSGNETFNADGSTVTTSYNADGSYTVTNNDGKGDITQANYTSAGVEASDAWQKANGTTGSDTFFAPGTFYNLLAEGQTTNPDGSSSQYQTIVNSNNLVETDTTFYASGGVVTGTSKNVNNGNGTATVSSYSVSGTLTETMTDTLNSVGAVTSDTWTKADGSSGTDTFNADGSTVSTTFSTDKSSTVVTSDAAGNSTADAYTSAGVLTSITWSASNPHVSSTVAANPDGSTTTTQTNSADHSSVTATVFSSGNSTKVLNDGHGDVTTEQFSSTQVLLSDTWSKSDGTSGGDTFNAGGSYSRTSSDGYGNSVTDNYSASGTPTNDSWVAANGSSGTDAYNANHSSVSITTNPDGSYTQTSNDGAGNLTEDLYSTTGVLESTDWYKSDGTFGYTNYATDGSVTSTFNSGETGASGSSIVDPFLAQEQGNVTITRLTSGRTVVGQIWQAANGDYGRDSINGESIVFHSDGSYSTYLKYSNYSNPWEQHGVLTNCNANGDSVSQQWSDVTTSPNSPAAGGFGQTQFASDGSSSGWASAIGGDSMTFTTDSAGNFWARGIDGGASFAVESRINGLFSAVDGGITIEGDGNTVIETNQNVDLSTLAQNNNLYQFGKTLDGVNYIYSNQSGQNNTNYGDTLGLPIDSTSPVAVFQYNQASYYNTKTNAAFSINQYSGGVNGILVGFGSSGLLTYYGNVVLGVSGGATQFRFEEEAIYTSPIIQVGMPAPGYTVTATASGDSWTNVNGMHGSNTGITGNIIGGSQLSAIISQNSGAAESILAGEKNQFFGVDGSSITVTTDINNNALIAFEDSSGVQAAELELSNTARVSQISGGAINQIEYYSDGSSTAYTSDGTEDIKIQQLNAAGFLMSDYWSKSDGTYGSDFDYPNGEVENFVYQADSSYSEKVTFSPGDTTTTDYNASGELTFESWTNPDGSSGSTTYNADGSSVSMSTSADGSYTTSTDDGNGDLYTNNYNASGALISDSWTLSNGNYGSDTYSGGALTGNTWYNASSNTSGSNTYNSAGKLVESSWTNSDGSSGSTTYHADGSNTTSSQDTQGDVYTDNYSASGVLTSDAWKLANGNSGTDTYVNGVISSDTWADASGVTGNDSYNASGALIYSKWTNTDGSWGSNTYDGNGTLTMTTATDPTGAETIQTPAGTDTITLGPVSTTLTNSGATDTVALGTTVAPDQLWFTQNGTDLVVSVLGSTENLTVKDWFNGLTNQVSAFVAGNGQTLAGSNVEQLVQAMAAFSPPTSSQIAYTTAEATNLDPVIAATWQ